MFYYAIPLSQKSKKYTNFWFCGQTYAHKSLPMGLKSSPFFAQLVSEKIFSNENLHRFAEAEGIVLGSELFPFTDVEAFRIIYIDDLLIHSSKELGLKVHLF